MSKLLFHTEDDGVVTLTLNRPEVHNAFDDELVCSLTDTLIRLNQDPQVRAVILTGAGESFSAGADLNWMQRMAGASEHDNEHDALQLARLLRTLNYLQRPTIARINGSAFGGGLGLVACCDVTIAAEPTRFALTEAHLGLAPAVISPYVYRKIGEHHARRYFLTGEHFDADRARAIGLVQEVVPPEGLDDAVATACAELRKSGPHAVAHCKKLVFHAAGLDPDVQLRQDQHTARLIAQLRVSAEGREGMQAFLDKRKPAWRDDD